MSSLHDTYKYWCYFIIPEYKERVCLEREDSLLYAYTDKKELAKEFETSRNMNLFKKKKYHLSKEEVHELAENYRNSLLVKYPGYTRSKNTVGSKLLYTNFVCTLYEQIYVTNIGNQIMLSKLWEYTWINPLIFKEGYQNFFQSSNYNLGYHMVSRSHSNRLDYPYDEITSMDLDDILKIMYPDFMSIFIHYFSYLLGK